VLRTARPVVEIGSLVAARDYRAQHVVSIHDRFHEDQRVVGRGESVDFCTVARWDNGQVVEENLFYDLVTVMKQIGLAK